MFAAAGGNRSEQHDDLRERDPPPVGIKVRFCTLVSSGHDNVSVSCAAISDIKTLYDEPAESLELL